MKAELEAMLARARAARLEAARLRLEADVLEAQVQEILAREEVPEQAEGQGGTPTECPKCGGCAFIDASTMGPEMTFICRNCKTRVKVPRIQGD